MKKPRYAEQQIARALRQVEQGTAAAEVCRKLGVSETTFYHWKKRYAGMGVAELRRVKQLPNDGQLGLPAGCAPRLQPARQADGQSLHRRLQWPPPGRASQHRVVLLGGRCPGEVTGVATGLQ